MTDLQNKPILYIDKERMLEQTRQSKGDVVETTAYEWKDEAVYHVRFGLGACPGSLPCYFLSEQNDIPSIKFPFIVIYTDVGKSYLLNENGAVACAVNYIPEKSELYSRSKGLLEIGLLEKKHVLVIGLGSFGSFIAIELAKAGVGKFTLMDFDRVEPANISRHICGIADLGRLKVHAVRDAILQKNPYAIIQTHTYDINEHPDKLEGVMKEADLTICVTDNNRSRFNVNQLAIRLNKTILFGRAITRAEGGDVFKMSGKNGPCYCCLIGDDGKMKYSGDEEISSARQTDELPAYVTEEDRNAVIQPGLSSDILPICNLIIKLALIELSGTQGSELSYPFYIWANRRESFYTNWSPFDMQDKRPTILRWYGVKVIKNPECMICS